MTRILEKARSLDAKALHKAAAKLKPRDRHFIDGKFVSSKKGKTARRSIRRPAT